MAEKKENPAKVLKGLTAVEIAQRSVDRLTGELEAAKARLKKAQDAEKANAGKTAKKAQNLWDRRAKVLEELGWTKDRIAEELGVRPKA